MVTDPNEIAIREAIRTEAESGAYDEELPEAEWLPIEGELPSEPPPYLPNVAPGDPVAETAVPEEASPFAAIPVPGEENLASLFNDLPDPMTPSVDASALRNKTLVLALARLGKGQDPLTTLTGELLEETRNLIRNQEERTLRNQIASQRSIDRSAALTHLKSSTLMTPADQQAIATAYGRSLQWDAEEEAAIAAEEAAVERMEELAASGNHVQAKIVYDNLIKGNANQVKKEYSATMLKMAQLAETYEAERQEEGWGSWAVNFALGLIPTNYNFSRTGIVPTSENGWGDFAAVGQSLSQQGQAIFAMPYRERMKYLEQGGGLDMSIRENADDFIFGKYDPSAATDIVAHLTTMSDHDRTIANIWGGVELAAMVPVRTLMGTTKAMITAGARREAVNAIRETADAIVNEGADAAAKKFGVTAKEVEDGMKITIVDPDVSNPNFVPLGMDVAARDEAARAMIADLPTIQQLSRITDPNELARAVDAAVDGFQKRLGRDVKDVSEVRVERMADGSEVRYVEVTIGKKEGGGFASSKTAVAAKRQMGLPDAELVTTATSRTVDPKDGLDLPVFHGTMENIDGALRPSEHGWLGPGLYVTPDKGKYLDYYAPEKAGSKVYPLLVRSAQIWGMKQMDKGWTKAEALNAVDELGLGPEARRMFEQRWAPFENGDIVTDTHRFYDNLSSTISGGNLYDEIAGTRTFGGDEAQNLLRDRLEAAGYHGIGAKTDGPEIVVFNANNAVSKFEAEQIVKDVSGQTFIKARVNVVETGMLTNFEHTPTISWWAKVVGTAPRVSDTQMHGKAVSAGSTVSRMQRIVDTVILKPLRTLPPQSKELVRQIAAAGSNHSRWWTDTEFHVMSNRMLGRSATDQELEAYRAFQKASDVDYVIRNDLMYKELAISGHENVVISTPWNQNFEVLGKVRRPEQRPSDRVFDASTGKHYNSKNPLTDARFEQIVNDGYVLVDIKGTIKLPDGTEVKKVMMKRSDGEFPGLSRTQLQYKEGGHRLYEADYRNFAKQTVEHTQPDTGTTFLKNPNTFVAGKTINEVRAWTHTMNRALNAYRANNAISPADLDEILAGRGFPSGEEFIQKIKSGDINTKHDFEAVYDRELPKAYTDASPSALTHMDMDDLGAMDYLGTTGRRFYGGKGEILKDTTGDIAMTVDPFDALSTSLRQLTRHSGLSNYKIEAMERFMKSYGEYLEPGPWRTAVDIFNNAPIKRGTPVQIKDQIDGQRSATRTVLGFETPFERAMTERHRQLAEMVLGNGTKGARKLAHDSVYWFKDNNPLSKLRGLAFDAKLGMFNLGQLFIQTSTIASAIAMSPRHGMKGAMGILPLHGYLLSRGSEAVLDTLNKRGVGRMMGFANEGEFKNYARQMYGSGFLDMNGTHVMVGEYGPQATFGSFGEKVHAVRESARVFFYTAETYNRMVSYRIGYGQAADEGFKVGTDAFQTRVMELADKYSFNMTHESASWWQKGLLSIPTQFWAYNVRMMDAMFGSAFTPAQRMRLAAMQVAIAGTAGLPIIDAIADYAHKQTGEEPPLETIAGTFNRGFMDRLALEVTGADVRISEKYGTGGWLTNTVKDIFGMGEYGEKPFDEMVGGASWSITKSALGALGSTVEYAHAEGGGGTMTKDHLLKMAMEVSTLSNAMKANMVANYGMLKSKSGTVLVHDLPSSQAFFTAMGFNPAEQEHLGNMRAFLEDKETSIKEASTVVRNWRQEAFSNPDMMQENMGKVRAFIQLQRPEDVPAILKGANMSTSESLYEHVATKFDEEKLREEALNGEAN